MSVQSRRAVRITRSLLRRPARSAGLAALCAAAIAACAVTPAGAQPADSTAPAIAADSAGLLSARRLMLPPYAGKYEARIGSSYEFVNTRLRLDIGAAMDIYHSATGNGAPVWTLGADFFTWTRLRATSSFKFPVEAVDYYFGVSGSALWGGRSGRAYGARLRVAHISAHIVDGDSSFTNPVAQYMTYSREFVDGMISIGNVGDADGYPAETKASFNAALRWYCGALALFHTIPDTLGRVSPYAGVDAAFQPGSGRSPRWRLGYELRLNTELKAVLEHQVRLGVKFSDLDRRGVLIEGIYYSGRSNYGQHFSEPDAYVALGFVVDI